jgi:hypothetical protein
MTMVGSLPGVPVVEMPDSGTGQELLAWAGIAAATAIGWQRSPGPVTG